jgi:lactam utilization protein B
MASRYSALSQASVWVHRPAPQPRVSYIVLHDMLYDRLTKNRSLGANIIDVLDRESERLRILAA